MDEKIVTWKKYLMKLLNIWKMYVSIIDEWIIFKKPFVWIYSLSAFLVLLYPIYTLTSMWFWSRIDNLWDIIWNVWNLLISMIVGWAWFQLLWNRKNKVEAVTDSKDDYVAVPLISYLIQTIGELGWLFTALTWTWMWILSLLSNKSMYWFSLFWINPSLVLIVFSPIVWLLIVINARFLSEVLSALTTIANNTKKK
jgi:hypothetical protein